MSHRTRAILVLGVTVLLIAPFHSAAGMVVRDVSLKEMVDLCTDACLGRVMHVAAEQDPSTGMIYTLAKISVKECVLGAVNDPELTVKTLGGEVGNVGLWVPGMPSFQVGEEVLLFLVRDDEGYYRVISGTMGKYAITKDPLTEDEIASNSVEGVYAVEESSGRESAEILQGTQMEWSIEAPLPRQIPLEVFLELIDEAKWR